MRLVKILVFLSLSFAFQPETKEELQTAVDLWISDNESALETYGEINTWDTSLITDMSELFYDDTWTGFYSAFNGDLSSWDVSSVTGMSQMFYGANSFNRDLSTWDVSSVTNMSWMFNETHAFNGDISSWDVSSVTNMSYMFQFAISFNGDISTWDVSSVTDMSFMFEYAESFNGDISSWDVSIVMSMSFMFYGADAFNGDLSYWDVSSVTDMGGMFYGANAFNGDLSYWDVSSVTDMGGMFAGALAFNGDLSSWDVSSVTDMSEMFYGANSFNGDLSSWDVSSVTDMYRMFRYANSFNGDLSSWDVSSVTNMNNMFYGVYAFNGDLSSWDVSSVTDMRFMFYSASSFNGDLSSWDVSSVMSMSFMFYSASSFNGDLSSWDVSSVTYMAGMFYYASSFNGDLSSWDVSSVTDMSGMFAYASSLSNYNKCLIHTSWSYNEAWGYDWSEFCFELDCNGSVTNYFFECECIHSSDICQYPETNYGPTICLPGSSTQNYFFLIDEITLFGNQIQNGIYGGYSDCNEFGNEVEHGCCPNDNCDILYAKFNDLVIGWNYPQFDVDDSVNAVITLVIHLNDGVTNYAENWPVIGDEIELNFYDASDNMVYNDILPGLVIGSDWYFQLGHINITGSNDICGVTYTCEEGGPPNIECTGPQEPEGCPEIEWEGFVIGENADCMGVCNGDAIVDECGVCNGNNDTCGLITTSFSFNPGNTLMSFPGKPNTTDTDVLLATITDSEVLFLIGQGVGFFHIDTNNDGTLDDWSGNLNDVTEYSGYWINVTDNVTNWQIPLDNGYSPECMNYTLTPGNNLISYVGVDDDPDYSTTDALGTEIVNIDNEDIPLSQLFTFAIGQGVGLFNTPAGWSGNLNHFNKKKGYWLNLSEDWPYPAQGGKFFRWGIGYNCTYGDLNYSEEINSDKFLNIPQEFRFTQSTEQAFYLIKDINIDSQEPQQGDILLAYNNDILVGSVEYDGAYTPVPVMGRDISPQTEGFCEVGEIQSSYSSQIQAIS